MVTRAVHDALVGVLADGRGARVGAAHEVHRVFELAQSPGGSEKKEKTHTAITSGNPFLLRK